MNNDQKALQLAKEWKSKEAEILALLVVMWKAREITELGFTSIFEYCVARLTLSESQEPIAAEISELRTTVDRKTEENIRALTDILSQKLGKAASLSEVIAFAAEFTRAKTDPTLRKKVSSGKRVALKRDDARCAYTAPDGRRCTARRHLHVHHIQHREHGGSDSADNLVTLCSAHHRHLHGPTAPPATSAQSPRAARASDSHAAAP